MDVEEWLVDVDEYEGKKKKTCKGGRERADG